MISHLRTLLLILTFSFAIAAHAEFGTPNFGSGGGFGNQYGNPYGNQFGGGMMGNGMGGGMGMGGMGMMNSQPIDMSKIREAADATLKEGPKVQEKIEKAGEAFGTNVGKMTDNFTSQVANINKSSDEDSIKAGFDQIREVTKSIAGDSSASTPLVDDIVKSQQDRAAAVSKSLQGISASIQEQMAAAQAAQQPQQGRIKDPLALVQDSLATNRPNSNLPVLRQGTGLNAGDGSADSGGANANGSVGNSLAGTNGASGNSFGGSGRSHGGHARGLTSEGSQTNQSNQKAYNLGGLGLQ